ncbi:hypothetical protein [Sphingomonas sp. RS2018]
MLLPPLLPAVVASPSNGRTGLSAGRALVAIVALAGTAACGDGRSNPATVPTATSTALDPMSESDIRRSAIACLQSPPYPVDGGPECLRPDGTWILYSDWGNKTGRYRIDGNHVVLMQQPGTMMPMPEKTIGFFRDRAGAMHISHDSDQRLFPLRPYPEDEYLRDLDRSARRLR